MKPNNEQALPSPHWPLPSMNRDAGGTMRPCLVRRTTSRMTGSRNSLRKSIASANACRIMRTGLVSRCCQNHREHAASATSCAIANRSNASRALRIDTRVRSDKTSGDFKDGRTRAC
jgi:hypothetical protein